MTGRRSCVAARFTEIQHFAEGVPGPFVGPEEESASPLRSGLA